MNLKKRNIDIYFILYLAAMILLIPSKKGDIGGGAQTVQTNDKYAPFSLLLDKKSLYCRLFVDNEGVKVNSIDSINTIFYSGPVENVKFEFILEDQSLRQKDTIKNFEYTNKFCRYEERTEKHTVLFYWNPPINISNNKIYKVTIIASGNLTSDIKENGFETILKKGQLVKTEEKFYLNMIYLNTNNYAQNFNNVIGSNGNTPSNFPNPSNIQSGPIDYQYGEISLTPGEYDIRAVAYQRWTNNIWVSGVDLNKSLTRQPTVRVENQPDNNGGLAEVSQILPNKIILTGRAPSHGRMKVILSALLKNEKNEKTIEFYVSPFAFREPVYDKWMYPERSYTIETNLPVKSGAVSKVTIKYNNQIRLSVEESDKVQFEPEIGDTGKIFILERYINEKLIDRSPIHILNYPPPIIYSLTYVSKDEVNIITNSYGVYRGKDNEVVRLALDNEGNAKEAGELRGQYRTLLDNNNMMHIQVFKCKRKDASKPFNFKVYVIDARGNRSEVKTYTE